jgi:hypothetical protein
MTPARVQKRTPTACHPSREAAPLRPRSEDARLVVPPSVRAATMSRSSKLGSSQLESSFGKQQAERLATAPKPAGQAAKRGTPHHSHPCRPPSSLVRQLARCRSTRVQDTTQHAAALRPTILLNSICDGSHTHLSIEEVLTTDAWRLCCPCVRGLAFYVVSGYRVPNDLRTSWLELN